MAKVQRISPRELLDGEARPILRTIVRNRGGVVGGVPVGPLRPEAGVVAPGVVGPVLPVAPKGWPSEPALTEPGAEFWPALALSCSMRGS